MTDAAATPPRARRHPFRGLGGGVLLGAGVTLLLISYSILPFGVATPWIVLIVFPVAGVLLGLLAPARTPRSRR